MNSGWFGPILERQDQILRIVRDIEADTDVLREGNANILRIVDQINKNGVKEADLMTIVRAIQELVASQAANTLLLEQIIKIMTPQPAVTAIGEISTP